MGQVKVQSTTNAERRVVAAIRGRPASDGAGVKLTRVIGQPALPDLDPFLMLDEFGSDKGADYIGGFPDHPHRGFETVTYMLAGPHAPWRQPGQCRPAASRLGAVDDRRARHHPFRDAGAGGRA